MKKITDLWRGYDKRSARAAWTCKHCSAIVDDPELHTQFHRDLVESIKLAAIA